LYKPYEIKNYCVYTRSPVVKFVKPDQWLSK